MNEKITKSEFIKSIDFIIKNKNDINKNNIKINNELKYNVFLMISLSPFFGFIYYHLIDFIFISLNADNTGNNGLFAACVVLLNAILSVVSSNYLQKIINKLMLKDRLKNSSYSVFSFLLNNHKKDLNVFKSKFKNINKLFRKKLPQNVFNYFKKLKYKNILNLEGYNLSYVFYNDLSYHLIYELKKKYKNDYSEEELMKTLSEYIIKSDVNLKDKLMKNIINSIDKYYTKKNEDLNTKKHIMNISGLIEDKEHIVIQEKIKTDIENNKKVLKVLNI